MGEAVQLGELKGTVGVFDVAEDAAGADSGKLLVVTDQPDSATQPSDELDDLVEGERVSHPSLINDQQRGWTDPGHPVGQLAVLQGPGEFGERLAGDAGLFAQDGGRGGGRRQADDLAAVLGPSAGEGAHSGGLPRPSGCDRQLQPGARTAHGPD